MRRTRRVVTVIVGVLVVMPIVIAACGGVVLLLWNHLMPQIFGLPAIGFWQALGLLCLSWLLFGGRRGFQPSWRWGMRERWQRMTPEQRAAFRQAMERRYGGCFGDAGDEGPTGEAVG